MNNAADSAHRVMPVLLIAAPILASIAFVLELTLVPLLLSEIRDVFSLDKRALSWVFNAYALSVALGVIAGGWLGDKVQAQRVFQMGVVLFALGALVTALSSNFQNLLLGRVIQGFGGGFFSPLVPILLTNAQPGKPGKILIVWGALTGFVAALAPFLGGPLVGLVGWSVIFVVFAVFAALALALSATNQTNDRLMIAGLPNIGTLLRARALWIIFGFIFCTYGCFTFFLFNQPLLLADSGRSLQFTGICLSLLWLSFALISIALRNVVDGRYLNVVLLSSPLLIFAGFVLSYFFDVAALIFAGSIMLGAGLACCNAPSTQLVLRFAPEGLRACSAGLDITFARLGGVVTVGAFASLSTGVAFAGIVVLSFCGLICAWYIFRHIVSEI